MDASRLDDLSKIEDPRRRLQETVAALGEIDRLRERAVTARDSAIVALLSAGVRNADVADMSNLTRGRVSQIAEQRSHAARMGDATPSVDPLGL